MKLIYLAGGLLTLYFILGVRKNSSKDDSDVNVSLTAIETKVMAYSDIIISEGYKQKMDPAAIAAVIHWESGGDANAKRKEYDNNVHWATSYGLMQLLDPTANWMKKLYPILKYDGYATKDNPANLYEPDVNIEIGTKFLYKNFMRYGRNLRWAYAAYNAGTCFVKELGYVLPCYKEQWGVFCSGSGDERVNDRVLGFYSLLKRYRVIYNQIYDNYSEYFNPVNYP
jgi:hypothetical protein